MSEMNASGSDAPLMLSVSGCRGIVGATMTPEVAARFAAFALAPRCNPGAGADGRVRQGRACGSGSLHLAAVAGCWARACAWLTWTWRRRRRWA